MGTSPNPRQNNIKPDARSTAAPHANGRLNGKVPKPKSERVCEFPEEPFTFDENPAAFDRTRSGKRTAEEQDERQQIYHHAIMQFVENKRLEDTLGQGELASMENGPRFFTLMKGLLPSMVRVFRRWPRPDTKLGVLILIHFCADNNDGLCRLSAERFSQILNRTIKNVQSAVDGLEETGVIGVHRSATGNSYWPIIARAVRDTTPNLSWFLDAFSEKPEPFGRPKKPYVAGDVSLNVESPVLEKDTSLAGKGYVAGGVHTFSKAQRSNKRRGVSEAPRVSAPKRTQFRVAGVRP